MLLLVSKPNPNPNPNPNLPSCHQLNGYRPHLDKMVSTGDPHLRGAQAQWLYRLQLMILIAPSDLSPGVHRHRDLPSCHQLNGYRPRLDKMVSTGDPHLRGTHDQWLVKRLNQSLLRLGLVILMVSSVVQHSLVLGLKSLPHPLSWVCLDRRW